MENLGPAQEDADISQLVSAASDIIGTAAGAGLGLAIGPGPGAVIGAAVGATFSHTLKKVGSEVKRRMLSPREESRIGAVFVLAAKETSDRLDAGELTRADGFFDEGAEHRSTAEEITEGVFLAAQREYEERKLRYLASLLSGLAFSADVDRAEAVGLLRLAQALSYRQLCLIAMCMRVGAVRAKAKNVLGPTRSAGVKVASIVAEMSDLGSRGVLIGKGTFGGGLGYLGDADQQNLTATGEQLYVLLGLDRLPAADIDAVLELIPDVSDESASSSA